MSTDPSPINPALAALRYHVTGAIERGEAEPLVEIPADPMPRPAHTPPATPDPDPDPDPAPEAAKILDPRTSATEEAFDLLAEAIRGNSTPDIDRINDALRVARSLMVPTAGPRPVTFEYPSAERRFKASSLQMLTDMLTTAVEGGIGYWSSVEVYRWDCPPAERRAEIRDSEDGKRYRVDLYTIREGMVRMRQAKRATDDLLLEDPDAAIPMYLPKPNSSFYEACRIVSVLLTADRDSERYEDAEGLVDADVADMVVQMGLFGQVVYG